jgi:predicted metal-binding protein
VAATITDKVIRLCAIAEEKGAVACPVDPADIVVSQWVRFKCRYGCKGYGKHMNCPPYTPPVEETRTMISEYSTGILLRFDGDPAHPDLAPEDIPVDFHPFFRDLIIWVNSTVYLLEKTAFYDGFYKAFGFGAYPCIYCDDCVPEEVEGPVDESFRRLCRHMEKARPGMEASGIDVFATARNVGWEIAPIPCKDMVYGKIVHGDIRSVGLVLIE